MAIRRIKSQNAFFLYIEFALFDSMLPVYITHLSTDQSKLTFGPYSKNVQNSLLKEYKADFHDALEKRNKTALKSIGRDSFEDLFPEDIPIESIDGLLVYADFPVQLIWINDRPISTFFPIVFHSNTRVCSVEEVLIISESPNLDFKKVQYIGSESLRRIKSHLRQFIGLVHVDGHNNKESLEIGSIKLFPEDLTSTNIFLNGCNTDKFNNAENSIYTISGVKDQTAVNCAKSFYSHFLGGLSAPHAVMNMIRENWKRDISAIAYAFKGNVNFRFRVILHEDLKISSKFQTNFSMIERPNLDEYYDQEKLIKYQGIQTTRVELFVGEFVEGDIIYSFDRKLFTLDDLIKPFKTEIINFRKKYHQQLYDSSLPWWDGTVINVNNLAISDQKMSIEMSPIKFDDLACVNLSPELYIESWGSSIREKYSPGPYLMSFEKSIHPNQIGIGAMIFTRDNYLILQRRSPKTFLTDKSQLGITCSAIGYLKYKENYCIEGIPSIFKGIKAQANEEIGINGEWFDELKLIGGSRSLENLGSLSFRFYGKLNKTLNQIIENWKTNNPEDHWEYQHFFTILFPTENNKIPEKITEIVNKYRGELPSSTLIAFYLLEKFFGG